MQLIAEICFFEPWWLKRMRSTSTKPIEPIAHTFLSSAAHTSQLSANTHQTESRKDTFKPWRLSAIRDNSSLRFWIISPQKMAKTITKKIEKILSTDLLSAAYSYKDQTIKGAGLASIFMPIALISVPQARAQAIRAVCVQNAGRGLGWKVSLLWMRGWWESFFLLFFLPTRNQAPCRMRCLWWFSQSKNWLHPIDRYQYSSCQSCSQTQWQTTSTKKEFHWKSHGDFMKKLKLLPRSGKKQWSLSSLVLYMNSLKQSMRYN